MPVSPPTRPGVRSERHLVSYVLAYDNTNRYFSGVAVSNTTSAAVNVTVTVRDGITGAVSGTHALALPAMGHKAFLLSTQERVSGTIRLKFFKGTCVVDGRKSPLTLYNYKLATYTKEDEFSHQAAAGFTELWGLPIELWARVGKEMGKKPKAGEK